MKLPADQVVILAAGAGSRLRGDRKISLKPLQRVAGRALIEHVIGAFHEVGVRKMHIVVGSGKDEITAHLRSAGAARWDLNFIENPYWSKQNGLSVLAARAQVTGPFFLSMADHLFEPSLVATLAQGAVSPELLYLAVDRKVESIFDLDDATKVRTRGDAIARIGKSLTTYDAIDAGVFVCPPALFAHLEAAQIDGDCSLSDGVLAMAAAGTARVVDIGDAFWQDVDTPAMLAQAEAGIAALSSASRNSPATTRG
jgi:1L-myo-inositol 1-phosphate cytidylyltransferase